MGKYMRKCRGAMGEEVAAMEVTQVVGVRTRSRSAAAGVTKVQVSRRRKALPPPSSTGDSAAVAARLDSKSCYLQLRSRMLFMAPPPAPATAARASGGSASQQGAVLAAVLSRCSSTASSADLAAQERISLACRSVDAPAEAGGDHVPQGSASDDSGSDRAREIRRETTPSSFLPGEVSDLESDLAGQKRSRPSPPATAADQQAAGARTPPAAEIEEFFAASEKAQATRFAAKYNFDVARGVPVDGGRFEWSPVVSS